VGRSGKRINWRPRCFLRFNVVPVRPPVTFFLRRLLLRLPLPAMYVTWQIDTPSVVVHIKYRALRSCTTVTCVCVCVCVYVCVPSFVEIDKDGTRTRPGVTCQPSRKHIPTNRQWLIWRRGRRDETVKLRRKRTPSGRVTLLKSLNKSWSVKRTLQSPDIFFRKITNFSKIRFGVYSVLSVAYGKQVFIQAPVTYYTFNFSRNDEFQLALNRTHPRVSIS